MIRDFITSRNFSDTTRTLATIKDLPATPPPADAKPPTLNPITADNTLSVLRGVNHASTQLLGGFKAVGNTTDGSRVYQNLGSESSADVEALAFIVMMEASKSAQEDLKSIMDGVKLINKQKDALRQVNDTVNKLAANNPPTNQARVALTELTRDFHL
jgi:hypothetical protein